MRAIGLGVFLRAAVAAVEGEGQTARQPDVRAEQDG